MIWQIGDCEIDDQRYEVRRAGRRVRLAPKPLALLMLLARRAPATVTKSEIKRALWPDAAVTAASLTRAVHAARVALGDGHGGDHADDSLLRTIRGRGYALETPTGTEITPALTPSESDDPFVGRSRELTRLQHALDDVFERRGRIAIVSGEPGIGKSRLLAELAPRASAAGALVVIGHCRDEEGAPPYWPWPEVITRLVEHDEGLVRRPRGPGAEELATIAPDLGLRIEAPSPPSGVSPADTRFRLFDSLTSLLRAASRDRPVVLVLDDLHHAGASALRALQFVGRAIGDAALLILAAYRSTAAPPNESLATTVGVLDSLPHAIPSLRLSGLSSGDVESYLRQRTGKAPDTDRVQVAHEITGGNPLFLRALVATRDAATPIEDAALGDRLARHPELTYLFEEQVRRLAPGTRHLLDAASVIGTEGSLDVLSAASRRRVETVREHLDEQDTRALLFIDADDRFRFAHDLVRRWLYQLLRPERRAELHHRVGAAIARRAGPAAETQVAELAQHFAAAVPRTPAPKAIRFAIQAAVQARARSDFAAAALHYRRALDVQQAAQPRALARRCDLLLALGQMERLGGAMGEARRTLLQAATLARARRWLPRLTEAVLTLAGCLQRAAGDREVGELLEYTLEQTTGNRHADRARLLAALAWLHQAVGEAKQSTGLLRSAASAARKARDPEIARDLLLHRLLVAQQGPPGEREERLALAGRVLTSATKTEHVDALLQARRHRIALLLELGDARALEQEMRDFAEASRRWRCHAHYAAAFRALRDLIAGRFGPARGAIDEAERLADRDTPTELLFTPATQRLQLPPVQPEREDLLRTIDEIVVQFPEVTPWRSARALAALDLGRRDRARVDLAFLAWDDFARVPRNLSYLLTLAVLAEVSWRLSEPRHVPRLYQLLRPHARYQITAGWGMGYYGPVAWYLGILASMLGRPRDAQRHLQSALRSTTRLRALPWRTRTQLTLAPLLACGSARERTRARVLAEGARAEAERLGLHGWWDAMPPCPPGALDR